MPLLRNITYLGLAKETTLGTAVAPTLFIPYTGSKPADLNAYADDDSIFGNASKVRGVYAGPKDSTFDFDGPVYPEVTGALLVASGLADTVAAPRSVADGVTTNLSPNITSATAAWTQADVGGSITGTGIPALTTILSVQSATAATMSANATATGSGITFTIGTATVYRHRFALPATGAQPPTYTLTDFNVVEARYYPGSIMDSVDFTLDPKGMVKYSAKFKGWPSTTATTPTPAFPTSASYMGWQGQISVAGTALARLTSATISIKRGSEVIHTIQNTQAPYTSFAGAFDADIKVKVLFENNNELNHFLNNDQPTLKIILTYPGGGTNPVLTFAGNVGAWKTGVQDRGSNYMQLDADIKPVYNATDGGMISALLTNATATAY